MSDKDFTKMVGLFNDRMKDAREIKESLYKIHNFSEEQINLFTDKLVYKNIKKREFLLKENQLSSCITFILSGGVRHFKKLNNSEVTLKFFTENNWVADLESLLTQQPSKNQIEAVENSEIASISLEDIHKLMDAHPCFRILNALMADLTVPTSYITTIHSKSPDERYRELLSKHPQWINRFPQMQIASYLGMTPETLSRVRARIK